MNFDDLNEELSQKPTPEMEEWFQKRTARHISLVQKYCQILADKYPDMGPRIISRGLFHDQSKFLEPEHTPYVWIAWDYHCKDQGKPCLIPPALKERMNAATLVHVKKNSHHPEFHVHGQYSEQEMLNRENRDAPPAVVVDASHMTPLDIMEMVADWSAMSEEKGKNTPRQWADKNINVRWKFTPEQVNLIHEFIDAAWEK